MNTYFKITTVHFKGKMLDRDFSGGRRDNWYKRPTSEHYVICGVTIDNDWYTGEEVRDRFPDIASKYSF